MRCKFCHNVIENHQGNWRTTTPGYQSLYYNCKQKINADISPDQLDAAPHQPMDNLELLEYKHEHKEK